MSDRAALAREAATALRMLADQRHSYPVLIGFDGFVDSIIAVVARRYDESRYDAVETIRELSEKIAAAAGQSANFELVVQQEKLGGNGPIMANALAILGLPVTYVGCLGYPSVHPVFEPLTGRARCISIANPGLTDALEFRDGKLLLGRHHLLHEASWERIATVIGEEPFQRIVGEARLLGVVNWTMLPNLNTILEQLIHGILPTQAQPGRPRPFAFIDLTDPQKRTREDLAEGLRLCSALQTQASVILGLNLREALQVAAVLGVDAPADAEKEAERLARDIRARMGIFTVVIHPRASAAGCELVGGEERSYQFAGPFISRPRLSTGAGDVFNAGFCLGRLTHLPLEQCLAVGTACSGFYVRNAANPTLEELADFLDVLPEPEGQ